MFKIKQLLFTQKNLSLKYLEVNGHKVWKLIKRSEKVTETHACKTVKQLLKQMIRLDIKHARI